MKIDTKCVQAGYTPKSGEPRVLPIVQSTTFRYGSSAEMAKLFDLEQDGYFYTRLANPTNDAVAAKIAALEGGVMAVLTGSGQAATFFSLFNICQAGDHIVASAAIYGGTYNLLAVTMSRMGIEVTFVDPDWDADRLQAAFRPNTKAMFAESVANPALIVLDFEKFAAVAHANGVPLVVDNTFPTPINCRPFDFGADIVIHSTTKYMDGHATTIGGVVVDSGNFDWMAHPDAFPGLTTPDPSYHGIVYAEKFGKEAYIRKIVVQLMRDLGAVQSPVNAFYLNAGLDTLALRMERHCRNAETVANYLAGDDRVSWVNYPTLPGSRYEALAKKYMPNGTCGVISFGVKGGREAAERFMDALRLAALVTHVADVRTCVLHPASTTHRQMTNGQLAECKISPDLVRLSVGIEDVSDIIADLDQALSKV
ncbi:MAG: O-acetylhomoserine aminocarboxypropyltransferase/cysteine synthase family protein [Eubacteriales bacterium]